LGCLDCLVGLPKPHVGKTKQHPGEAAPFSPNQPPDSMPHRLQLVSINYRDTGSIIEPLVVHLSGKRKKVRGQKGLRGMSLPFSLPGKARDDQAFHTHGKKHTKRHRGSGSHGGSRQFGTESKATARSGRYCGWFALRVRCLPASGQSESLSNVSELLFSGIWDLKHSLHLSRNSSLPSSQLGQGLTMSNLGWCRCKSDEDLFER
jgi:hypothetical protein